MTPLIDAVLHILMNSNEDIPHQLQQVAVSRRHTSSSTEKESLALKQSALEIVYDINQSGVLNQEPTPPTDNIGYLGMLARWFESEECKHKEKDILAVECRHAEFTLFLAHETNPQGLISFGTNYFYDPIKFTGFILWLLDSVPPQTLIDSKLLHGFFAALYYCLGDSDNPIHTVYGLLRRLDDKNVKTLISIADATHSGVRGSVLNHKVSKEGENEVLESSNLTGGMLRHARPLEVSPAISFPPLQYTQTTENIDVLWRLYGMDFISALTWNDSAHQAIERILAKDDKFLSQLPDYIIQGKMTLSSARTLFHFLGTRTDIALMIANNPFYVLLFPFISPERLGDLSDFEFSIESYLESIESLSTNEAIFLQSLCGLISQKKLPFAERINRKAFSLFMASSDLSIEAQQALRRLPDVRSLSIEHVNNMTLQLDDVWVNEDSFDALSAAWGGQLIKLNLLKHIAPEVSYLTRYPLNKHELMGFMIETKFRTDPSINLVETIESMQVDTAPEDKLRTRQRILLETLVYTQEEALQNLIVAQLESLDEKWSKKLLGHESLLNRAISRGNKVLTHRLLKLKNNKPNQAELERALESAANQGEVTIVIEILKLSESEPNQALVKRAFESALNQDQVPAAIEILKLSGRNEPNQAAFNFALRISVQRGQWSVVSEILKLSGSWEPDQEVLMDGYSIAAREGQETLAIEILKLIMGRNEPDLAVVMRALEIALKHGQATAVIEILKLSGRSEPNPSAVMGAFYTAMSISQWGVVSEILKLSGGKNPSQREVEQVLMMAAYKGEWSVVTQIVDITKDNANKPGKDVLNNILLRARVAQNKEACISLSSALTNLEQVSNRPSI